MFASRYTNRVGAAAVEFAIVSAVLLLVVCVGFEFSRAIMLQNVVETVAYESARTMIVPGATSAEGRTRAERLLTSATVRQSEVNIEPSTLTDATTQVTVTIRAPYRENSWILPRFLSNHVVESQITLFTERNPFEQAEAIERLPLKSKLQKSASTTRSRATSRSSPCARSHTRTTTFTATATSSAATTTSIPLGR